MTTPLKIKRYRQKKFTKKRDPYKTYINADWNWMEVFDKIEILKKEYKRGYIKIAADIYGIKYNTLRHKYFQYDRSKIENINNENRGNNKIFNENDERELYTHLKINFIDKNLPLCNEDLKTIALNKFKSKNNNTNFKASNGWCNEFKKRWKLTSVTPTISRKTSTIHNPKIICNFVNNCIKLCEDVGKPFFLI